MEKLKLNRNKVLIELPSYANEKVREHKSGLMINFAFSAEEVYAPVHGIIVNKGISVDEVELGDQVFFHFLSYINAKNTPEQLKKGHYDPSKTTWDEDGKRYLLMPVDELIMAKRGEQIIALNNYVLLKAIPLKLKEEYYTDHLGIKTKLVIQDNDSLIAEAAPSVTYRTDIAEVYSAQPHTGLKKGQIVYPHKDWDVPLEYDMLQELNETLYYVHFDVIVGTQKPQHIES